MRPVPPSLTLPGGATPLPGGEVRVSGRSDGASVTLSVVDSGRGMSGAQLERLFEPFDRLGAEREGIEGTGIGMTIVKTLVTSMGGTIAVSSTPGIGSRFDVTLPAADPAMPFVPAPEPPSARLCSCVSRPSTRWKLASVASCGSSVADWSKSCEDGTSAVLSTIHSGSSVTASRRFRFISVTTWTW